MTTEKRTGLLVNLLLYILSFAVGLIPFSYFDNLFAAEAALTLTATFVIFIATCVIPDTSLYDPYWSVAPVVMLLAAMKKYELKSMNAFLMLIFVSIWAARLTVNWAAAYKGLLHEDWRYSMFREKRGPIAYALLNLFGFQLMPTLVVYLGLIGAFFVLRSDGFTPLILLGVSVMLLGTALELISDSAIHKFLQDKKNYGSTCNISVWKYSRHPNYLGEMTFWTGIFIAYVTVYPEKWYYGLGFLAIITVFVTVSIPMMEKHNLERRSDYSEYMKNTSTLFIIPKKA